MVGEQIVIPKMNYGTKFTEKININPNKENKDKRKYEKESINNSSSR